MERYEPESPASVVKKTLASLHERMEGALDPFGMSAPILHAQLAWFSHPQELSQRLNAFSNDLWHLQWHAFYRAVGHSHPDPLEPHPDDKRFVDEWWSDSSYWDFSKEWYLAFTRNMQDMLYETPGLSSKERRRAAFWWRKWLNAVAPTNFFWTNPGAIQRAVETNGASVIKGFQNMLADIEAGELRMTNPDDFSVGKNLATTPGMVIFRNELLEVIHYTPTQKRVHAEPVVIITPWINKFYILDLTPKKSMIRFLLDQGLDVFITSWKNPDASMRDTRFDDYIEHGIHAIVETARQVSGANKVHAAGYCIGGTALAMYMAWANRRFEVDQVPVATFTLFTTLVDFHKPGDIEVFIDEASVRYINDKIARKGYLDGKEMAASFRLLRSNSLIWHYVVHGWLYGETPPPFDVLYWNMDATRMPYAMHSWYLQELYLHNRLIQPGALKVAGEELDLSNISQPLYAVAAEDDHIAPWEQAFKVTNHVAGAKRFVLSSSGHILGIINPPVTPPKRKYWVGGAEKTDHADAWRKGSVACEGSWWDDWMQWLKPNCGPLRESHPVQSRAFPKLADAPGHYVLER